MLNVGDKAPDFTLPSTAGENFALSKNFRGKSCILFFYPKDFTKGCTAEVCEFRDHFGFLEDLAIPIVGISRDDLSTHYKFKSTYNLPYHLLSDKSGKVCKAYDALIPVIGLPKRVTYLLDDSHHIKGIYQDMFDAKGHIKYMLKKL
ncbi:peroxiredoxin [Negadavirga shengliensis]|uniref:thioredoxin-dependent peroxiredoxin n=1 Tax=Negadavirga shengliensis TaxID=1389218 RepID=A0ABV9SZD2_9BACT